MYHLAGGISYAPDILKKSILHLGVRIRLRHFPAPSAPCLASARPMGRAAPRALGRPFRAAFFEDLIEKGRGTVFAVRYDDVHDIIEWCRIPRLAVIRLKGGAGELLVRTDLMEPATWQCIKKLYSA